LKGEEGSFVAALLRMTVKREAGMMDALGDFLPRQQRVDRKFGKE